MPELFFSIIVPTYNRAYLIGKTMESLLNQTFKDFELIIVDDGSTDNTKYTVTPYLSDPRVKYIYQENKERGAARNRGAKEAKGKYFLFFDSDDIALSNHLQKAYELIMKYGIETVKWMHGNYNELYENRVIHPEIKPLSGWVTKLLIKGNNIWICTMFIRRDFFEALWFDEDRELAGSEDWEFAIRASLKEAIFYQPEPTVLLVQHQGRSMLSPESVERSKLSSTYKILSNQKTKNSIYRYKRVIYANSNLLIAITYFSANDIKNAKLFFKKAILSDLSSIVYPRFIKWFVRIYILPLRNFSAKHNQVLYITYNGLTQPLGRSQVLGYITGLSKQGYKITILSFEHYYEKDFNTEQDKVINLLDKTDVEWIPLKYHKYPLFFSSVYDILHGISKAFIIFLKKPYGIVHARSAVPGMIGLILKKIFNIKFVFDMRELHADEKIDMLQWTKNSLSYKLTRLAEKKMLIGADALIVLVERIKPYFRSFTYINAPISVIPTCVDPSYFPQRDEGQRGAIRKMLNISDRFVIVYSGSLGALYMFDKMVEFFKTIKENCPEALFLIVNRNENDYARAFLAENGINATDYIIKVANYDEVHKYLWASDIGISFIKPGFSKLAALPTKFGEYVSCGLPVIANAGIGDVEELLLDNMTGAVVQEFSVNEYKRVFEHILYLIKDPGFSSRAQNMIKTFMSVSVGVNKYREVYDKL